MGRMHLVVNVTVTVSSVSGSRMMTGEFVLTT